MPRLSRAGRPVRRILFLMRLFISHCISDNEFRPDEHRDSSVTVAALKVLGDDLVKAGHRVFEYQHQRAESRTTDILEMMALQIQLADAVVFVVSRSRYVAPGWTVPELFYARALGKEVLSVALEGGQAFKPEQYGDAVSPRRYRSLVPAGIVCPGVEALLQSLNELQKKAGAKCGGRANAFDLAFVLCEWSKNDWSSLNQGRPASVEHFLNDYHDAWEGGFRPARFFMQPYPAPEDHAQSGCQVERVSRFLDDCHIIALWYSAAEEKRSLSLLNVRTGQSVATKAPEVLPLAAGTSAEGGLVTITATARADHVRVEKVHSRGQLGTGSGQSHTFVAALPAKTCSGGGLTTTSGVIADCWFAGSILLRIVWDGQRLEEITPQPQDWVRFCHFGWLETPPPLPHAHTPDLPREAEPRMVRFPGLPELWTMLPCDWQHLCGDTFETRGFLVAWRQGQLAFGRVDACPSFGSELPEIAVLPDPGNIFTDASDAPRFLQKVRKSRAATGEEPQPLDFLNRVENEMSLVLKWHGLPTQTGLRNSGNSCLFQFTAEREAMMELSHDLTAHPLPRC